MFIIFYLNTIKKSLNYNFLDRPYNNLTFQLFNSFGTAIGYNMAGQTTNN